MDLAFEAATPLDFVLRCTTSYWEYIVSHKHPVLRGREKDVARTLEDPDEIRRSQKDPAVLLFYRRRKPRWLCAVACHKKGSGFLIKAYPTDVIKVGETIWTRSK